MIPSIWSGAVTAVKNPRQDNRPGDKVKLVSQQQQKPENKMLATDWQALADSDLLYATTNGGLKKPPGFVGSHAHGQKTRWPGLPECRHSRLLVYIKDDITDQRFLCDTGDSYDVYLHQSYQT